MWLQHRPRVVGGRRGSFTRCLMRPRWHSPSSAPAGGERGRPAEGAELWQQQKALLHLCPAVLCQQARGKGPWVKKGRRRGFKQLVPCTASVLG